MQRDHNFVARGSAVLVALLLLTAPHSIAAQTPSTPTQPTSTDTPMPSKVMGQVPTTGTYAVAGEVTDILQNLFAFHSPYTGPSSLVSRNESEITHTYRLYLGARPTPRLEVYINPELALGNGIGDGIGLVGYSNGDLIGQPTLPPRPISRGSSCGGESRLAGWERR